MSCADVECNKMSNAQKAFNPCCNGSRAITPAKKQKDNRSTVQKVAEGEYGKRGGRTDDADQSSKADNNTGTGDSDKCTGCDKAGDWGCELGKLSCEFTSAAGDKLPIIALAVGAVIILLVALR